jgi:2-C-methyl-D-erythritol 4-phosphate cytidylyltransferase
VIRLVADFRSRPKPKDLAHRKRVLRNTGGEHEGVVLAGGTGSRLNPLTRVTNKHLLPIYDKPMVYVPIQTLLNAGICEIPLVAGGKNAGDFFDFSGMGEILA